MIQMSEFDKLLLLILLIVAGIRFLHWCLKRRFPVESIENDSYPFYFTHFDPNNGLERQSPFWASIFIPIILFCSTGIFVWIETTPNVSAEGFNTFISISQLPIGLLALAIPLAVLTGRIHGTKQTALQIEKTQNQIDETQQKNKTDLYLAHYNFFSNYLAEMSNSFSNDKALKAHSVLRFDVNHLYRNLYPNSSMSSGCQPKVNRRFEIIHPIFESLNQDVKQINIIGYSDCGFYRLLKEINVKTKRIIDLLGINNQLEDIFEVNSHYLSNNYVDYQNDEKNQSVTIFNECEDLKNIPNLLIRITQLLYKFDSDDNSLNFLFLNFMSIPLPPKDPVVSNFKLLNLNKVK